MKLFVQFDHLYVSQFVVKKIQLWSLFFLNLQFRQKFVQVVHANWFSFNYLSITWLFKKLSKHLNELKSKLITLPLLVLTQFETKIHLLKQQSDFSMMCSWTFIFLRKGKSILTFVIRAYYDFLHFRRGITKPLLFSLPVENVFSYINSQLSRCSTAQLRGLVLDCF